MTQRVFDLDGLISCLQQLEDKLTEKVEDWNSNIAVPMASLISIAVILAGVARTASKGKGKVCDSELKSKIVRKLEKGQYCVASYGKEVEIIRDAVIVCRHSAEALRDCRASKMPAKEERIYVHTLERCLAVLQREYFKYVGNKELEDAAASRVEELEKRESGAQCDSLISDLALTGSCTVKGSRPVRVGGGNSASAKDLKQ